MASVETIATEEGIAHVTERRFGIVKLSSYATLTITGIGAYITMFDSLYDAGIDTMVGVAVACGVSLIAYLRENKHSRSQ